MVGSQSMGNLTLWPKAILCLLLIITVEEFPGSLSGWLSTIALKRFLWKSNYCRVVMLVTELHLILELPAVLKSVSPVPPAAWKYKLEKKQSMSWTELCLNHVWLRDGCVLPETLNHPRSDLLPAHHAEHPDPTDPADGRFWGSWAAPRLLSLKYDFLIFWTDFWNLLFYNSVALQMMEKIFITL